MAIEYGVFKVRTVRGPRLGLATSRLDNRVHPVLPLCFTTRPTHSFDLACGA